MAPPYPRYQVAFWPAAGEPAVTGDGETLQVAMVELLRRIAVEEERLHALAAELAEAWTTYSERAAL